MPPSHSLREHNLPTDALILRLLKVPKPTVKGGHAAKQYDSLKASFDRLLACAFHCHMECAARMCAASATTTLNEKMVAFLESFAQAARDGSQRDVIRRQLGGTSMAMQFFTGVPDTANYSAANGPGSQPDGALDLSVTARDALATTVVTSPDVPGGYEGASSGASQPGPAFAADNLLRGGCANCEMSPLVFDALLKHYRERAAGKSIRTTHGAKMALGRAALRAVIKLLGAPSKKHTQKSVDAACKKRMQLFSVAS